MRRRDNRNSYDAAARRTTGLELVRREPRDLYPRGMGTTRAEVYEMIQDAMRQLRLEDAQETGSVPDDRYFNVSLNVGQPTYEDEEQDRAPVPPAVPQPPDQDGFITISTGQRPGPPYPISNGPGPGPMGDPFPVPPLGQQHRPLSPEPDRCGGARSRIVALLLARARTREPQDQYGHPNPFVPDPPSAVNGMREQPQGPYPPQNMGQLPRRDLPPQPSTSARTGPAAPRP